MSKFGWSYPAGAENDPNAPYNEEPDYRDAEVDEPIIGEPVTCPCCQGQAEWFEEPGSGFLGWVCASCCWEQEAIDENFSGVTT